jgi:hypothetical protein
MMMNKQKKELREIIKYQFLQILEINPKFLFPINI